jgi:2-polyprenyl-3-methyl-5-hydroxy-6-metoxy-1,4-benzoquinol methylase
MQPDNTGRETLEVIAKADSFNQWMFRTIYPYCRGKILEIGSGIGNISQFFLEKTEHITLSDTDNFYVQDLKKRFPVTDVLSIDLEHPAFATAYKELLHQYDTVFLLNVLEHINNDETAISNCNRLLKSGGCLVILTPAYPFLYSKIDKGLHHFRRYTKRSLNNVISKNDFIIKNLFYFNALWIAGWLYGKLAGLKKIPQGEMKLFNKFVWLAKILDKLLFKRIGLSIIAVAEKK